jgi:hypothetical protein
MKNKIQETLRIKRKGVRIPVQVTLATSKLTDFRPADTRQSSDFREFWERIPSSSTDPTRLSVRIFAARRLSGSSSSSV